MTLTVTAETPQKNMTILLLQSRLHMDTFPQQIMGREDYIIRQKD